ncbi:MAG: TetR/AcrR family transcriptional regulator [Pseudomonadales bacterium]|nr:TetR/AcrR family transcriptional regulator [Pseudomonadales bacterium]
MQQQRARRMAPAERRVQILDAAAALILRNGHSNCTLEQVANVAGVSKPLIYKYFPRRDDLMIALLTREFDELAGHGLDALPKDMAVGQVAGLTIERALRYYDERGPILKILSSDPAVTAAARAGNRASRTNTTDYFIKRSVKEYGVPEDVATIAVTMVVNAPIHSVSYLNRKDIDIEQTIEVWREFVAGGWRALEERYGKK